MSIGEKIRKRREELGLSQAELAKRIGVTQGSIGNYESGVSNPKMEIIPKLFEALHTDANYFFSEASQLQRLEFTYNETLMIKKYRTLDEYGKKAVSDLLETEFERCESYRTSAKADTIEIKMSTLSASAGTGEYLEDEGYRQIYVKRTATAEQADFAVKVNGNSMEDTYYDGDILLVENTPHINVGDIGVFTVNGEGYVKEYGGDRLISHNDEYDDILLHDYDMVLCSGRVIGVAEFVK